MDARTEKERLQANNELASMPANPWEFEIDLGSHPDATLEKILAVLRIIAAHSADEWPSDDEWKGALPVWLLSSLPELTKEETDRLLATTPRDRWDSLPWEFGSWLDAVRDRGWLWWGHRREGSRAKVVVHIAMLPERIDAFKELLRVAGATVLTEKYAAL